MSSSGSIYLLPQSFPGLASPWENVHNAWKKKIFVLFFWTTKMNSLLPLWEIKKPNQI